MRPLYLSLAALFVTLAGLGVLLPVLPTTPFLLLTSWCLVRSSPTWHARLCRSPLFGPLLADWERHHGVRLHVKVTALGMLAVAVGTSLWLGPDSSWLRGLLLALAAVGAGVILRLRTVSDDAS